MPPFKHVFGFDPGGKVNINLTLERKQANFE